MTFNPEDIPPPDVSREGAIAEKEQERELGGVKVTKLVGYSVECDPEYAVMGFFKKIKNFFSRKE
jgi:hypothetical protein